MCYYATTDYSCGDWKWGNMMERCPRQHRIGETCGAKLVHHESVTKANTECKVCAEIFIKRRRLAKTDENITRWSQEPEKFSASLEKALRERRELHSKIQDLHMRRTSIATNINTTASSVTSSRQGLASVAAGTTLPPVTTLPVSTTRGYEYTSASGPMRRQESVPRNGTTQGTVSVGRVVSSNQSRTAVQYASLPAGSYYGRNSTR